MSSEPVVDTKMESLTKPNEADGFNKHSRSSNEWQRRKTNGENDHHHNGNENRNWRSRQGKPRSQGYNWHQGDRSNRGQHCDRDINNKKKEVIIYYNDPKVTDDVVQELIENVAKEPLSLASDKENSFQVKSKSLQKPKSVNGKINNNNKKTPQTTSHKSNTQATKPEKDKDSAQPAQSTISSPVTIFYGTGEVSLPTSLCTSQDDQTAKSVDDIKVSNEIVSKDKSAKSLDEEKAKNTAEKNKFEETIKKDQAESLPKLVPKSVGLESKVIEFKPSSTSGPDDVITGGIPIPPPSLPWNNEQPDKLHRLVCTLVSHPGHFYIRFDNADDAKQLASLDEFYNSDEAIELSVDVLRPGQYFAVRRIQASCSRREWVRAQLLHIESADMLNCLLIDEGCFGVFRLADLQPLYSPFRSVPKQAIRAEIQGIAPPESATDWLPKQALQFKALVSDRPLYTRLDVNEHRKQLESGQRLQLDLFFGQTQEEAGEKELCGRSIASILIEQNLAISKANNN